MNVESSPGRTSQGFVAEAAASDISRPVHEAGKSFILIKLPETQQEALP